MDRELIAYFDERFRELREESSQQFGQLGQRVDQLSDRVDQLADAVHTTQIMVEDLRGKIELVAEGVVGTNERLDTSREEGKEEAKELRNLFTFPVQKLDGRVKVVEARTTRHTREIAALRRRAEKPRSRPS